MLVAVPRLLARLALATPPAAGQDPEEPVTLRLPLGEAVWAGTRLALPALSPSRWRDVLTGESVTLTSVPDGAAAALRLADLLRAFPVALLVAED